MKAHRFLFAIFYVVSTTQILFSQTLPAIEKISSEKILNFAFTHKRGIKAENGVIYFVEQDGQTLTAYENNKIKWTSNILKSCPAPKAGKPAIRYIELTVDTIEITYGKHSFARANIADGKINCLGSD